MKDNLENIIKQSLEGHEMSYNSKAWDSMKSKLDAKSAPVHKPNYSLYIAASALIAVAIGSIYYVNNGNVESNTPKIEITETLKGTQNNIDPMNASKENKHLYRNTEENTNSTENNNSQSELEEANAEEEVFTFEGTEEINNSLEVIVDPIRIEEELVVQSSEVFKFNSPVIANGCVGMNMNVTNDNDYNLTVVYPNGQVWTGKKNSNTTLNPSVSGVYKVGYMDDNKFNEKENFIINAQPYVDFSFDNIDEIYNEKRTTSN